MERANHGAERIVKELHSFDFRAMIMGMALIRYAFELLREESGPPLTVDYWPHQIPSPAVLLATPPGHESSVRMSLESTRTELPRLVSITVSARPGLKLTGADLRRLRVAELTAHAVRFLAGEAEQDGGVWTFDQGQGIPMWQQPAVLENWNPSRGLDMRAHRDVVAQIELEGPRSSYTTRTVGALYFEAERYGFPPNKHVADVLGLSKATASNWVKYAREAGTVPPSSRRSVRRDA